MLENFNFRALLNLIRMKKITLLLGIILCSLSNYSQNQEIDYPFAAPGSKVSRGVFGTDGRIEVKDAEGYQDFVRATAVMINKDNIYNNEFYSWSLRERLSKQFGTNNFSEDVKFLDQPAIGSCTGFLIAPDVLVTAGHCINSMEDANKYVWVFDYTSESDFIDGRRLQFNPENIFEVESIITSDLNDQTKDDYAVLKLKRKSTRAPYRFRTSGSVNIGGPINTIGAPTGLPLKFSTDAVVVANSANNWFKSNIDSFPGNSGGPVFDQNGFIEGILVRGAVQLSSGRYTGDYKYDSSCDCIKTVQWDYVDYTAGCQSHKITSVPGEALINAIYENLKYAIENNLNNRFNSWSIYQWVFSGEYTKSQERLESIALKSRNSYALNKILKTTAEENISDEFARELIDMTLDMNYNEGLETLLKNNILADAGANKNNTALHIAATKQLNNRANLLIKYGADVDAQDGNKSTPLSLSINLKNYELVKLLLENDADIEKRTSEGFTPLHTSALSLNLNITKLLVSKGAKINAKSNKDYTPLMVAIRNEANDTAEFLLENEAEVNAKDSSGDTALEMAVSGNNYSGAGLLLKYGANQRLSKINDKTLLGHAVINGNSKLAELLIKNDGNINIVNSSGENLLHLVAKNGDFEMARILIENGLSPDAKTSYGKRPEQLAKKAKYKTLAKYLKKQRKLRR